MGSNVVPAPPPGFTLVEDSAVPPPPAGFTLQQGPSAEVPPPPPGFTLIDGPSAASPKVDGTNGSAVPEVLPSAAGAPRSVTQPSATDLALQSMPPGFKLLSDATGFTGAANTVESALTSPDTPGQAAAKKRITASAAQPDESSLLSDLSKSYTSYSKGALTAEYATLEDQLASTEASSDPKLKEFGRLTVKPKRDEVLKQIRERHLTPPTADNPTFKALNMEQNTDASTALKNTITALGTDPWGVFRSAAAQSGAASIPSIVGGVAGSIAGPYGAAVGAGFGSYQSEYGSDLVQGLQDFGADMGNEKSIADTYRAHGAEIKRNATKKAVVVGFMDGVSGGIEGRIAQLPVSGFRRRAAQMAAGSLVSQVGGMAGEAGGQIAVDGGISDYNAVYQEALGEVVPGALTEAGQIAGHQLMKLKPGGPLPTEDELKRLWDESNPGEPISTFRDATNAGRTLYGFAEEGKPTQVGSYADAEAIAGQGDFRRGRLIAIDPSQVQTSRPNHSVEDILQLAQNPDVDPTVYDSLLHEPYGNAVLQALTEYDQRKPFHSDEAEKQLRDTITPLLTGAAVYTGPTVGLAITPREDNYLHGTITARTYNTDMHDEYRVYTTRGNESNAIDLDKFKDQTDGVGFTIVPLTVARRIQVTPDLANVADQTFNYTSPAVRQMLHTSIDNNLITELFQTKQITWKGRLDPRFLTSGLHDAETDGFRVLDTTGADAGTDFVAPLWQEAQIEFKHPLRRISSAMRYLLGTFASPAQIDELDVYMSQQPDVVAFGEHPDMKRMTKFVERIRTLSGMKQQIIFVVARPFHTVQADGTMRTTWSAPGFDKAMPITAQDMKNHMAGYHGANGFHNVLTPGVSIVAITDSADPNSKFVHPGPELLEVIAHEMGHALVADRLIAAPLATVLKVYSAFRRFREAHDSNTALNSTKGDWVDRVRSPFFGEDSKTPYSYSATMEEWLAEQVARWALSDAKALGTVTRLFRDIGKKIIFTLKALRDKGQDFKPEVEMEAWLKSLYKKETVTTYSDQIQKMTNIASTHQNHQVDPDPTPAHEDSADLHVVLDEFGPKRKPFSTANYQSAVKNAAVTRAVVDKYNWFYKWAANLRQLAEANPHIKELQVARELFAFAKMESSKIMVSADTTLQAWRKLGDKRGRQLSAFLFDLNEMNYLSDTERQAGVMRWPTSQEFIDLAKSYQFDQEMIQVYKDVRDFFLETVKREEELKLVDAQKITDPKLQLEAIAAAKKTSATLISKPYFPQTRFGKYSLTVRSKVNNKLEHFELFETKREAKVAAYQATKMWPEADWDVVQSELREDVQQFTGMSPWMLDKIRNMPGLTKDQLLWIDELRYQIAPSQSFTKHMMRRKKYTGFSTDGRRTFASYAFHHARNYPRVKFADAFRETIKALDMSLPPGYSPLERAKRKPMADMLQHQVNEFMNPSQDWAQLRAMNAIWHLGFNAKSAVVNMTQVFFSASFLGAKFGGVRAEAAILAAGAKLNSFYKKGAYHKSTDAEFKAIDRAMKDGHIDESMAAELAALAVGGGMGARIGKSLIGDSFLRGYIGFTEKAMWMFRMAEQWQRRIVFRAAWQLAVDNPSNIWVNSQAQKNPLLYAQLQKEGWSAREALAYLSGVDALQSTIGVYDRDSRARYAQGRKSVLFAFQSFTQQMLWTLWNNKDMWARYMLYYAVIGGSMGIIPDDFKGLLTLMGRMLFGNQFDLERSVREFVVEMLGEDSKIPPDLILHGTARYGFGIPMIMQTLGAKFVPDVDLSPSITLNRLLPIDLGKINMPGAHFNDVLTTQVEAASGAAYGIPIAVWKALSTSDMDITDFKRWEGAVPSAARNVSKAFRYGFGQGERDKNFATTVGFDGDDPEQLGEIIATALGFRPTRLAQQYDRQTAAREIDQFWSVRKEMLMRQAYRDKFVYKDVDAYKETMRQIHSYNKEVFDKKYLITREGLMQSMKSRAKAVIKVETGQAEPPQLRSAMDRMFPETVEEKKVK